MVSQKLTSGADERLVVLAVHVDGPDNGVIEDGLLLLENLLGGRDLLLGSLDLHLDHLDVPVGGDIDLGTGGQAQLLQGRPSLANQGRDLLLLDRHRSRERVVLQVLVERVELIASTVRAPAGTANHHLIGSLLALRLARVARRVGLVLGRGLGRPREEDEHLVTVLEPVDLGPLLADELPVELGVDLEGVGGLIRPAAAKGEDVRLGLLGLVLGTLELNLAVLDLDLHVKLVAEIPDVAAALSDEVVGELLGEVKGQSEPALLLVLLLLLHKLLDLLSQGLDSGRGALQGDLRLRRRHPDGDLLLRPTAILLALDEPP